jgi:DNA-binding transcriptional regulator YiaG
MDSKKDPKEIIQNIRRKTGLSRTEFSQKYGIPLRTLEEWESGRRTPPEYIPRMLAYYVYFSETIDNPGDLL